MKNPEGEADQVVEKAYRRRGGRIAILGGIDADSLCRASLGSLSQWTGDAPNRGGARDAAEPTDGKVDSDDRRLRRG